MDEKKVLDSRVNYLPAGTQIQINGQSFDLSHCGQ